MCDDFNWSSDRDSVVVLEQREIAVYRNCHGQIVLRENAYPDDDQIVVIDPSNVRRVADAMLEAAGLRPAGEPLKAPPQPCVRQQEPQGRASDAPSMGLRQSNGDATGDLLEGVAHG